MKSFHGTSRSGHIALGTSLHENSLVLWCVSQIIVFHEKKCQMKSHIVTSSLNCCKKISPDELTMKNHVIMM